MAHNEGAQGYLYEAMVCVLSAIRENGDIQVQLEPDFTDQKVDIAFVQRGGRRVAVQVKASAGRATEKEVSGWLKRFIEGAPDASSYRFMLVGACSEKAGELIESFGRGDKTVKKILSEAKAEQDTRERVAIEVIDSGFGYFEARVAESLGALLKDYGYSTDFAQLQFIAAAICYRFNKLSTHSKFIPGAALTRKIVEWIELFYPVVVSSKKKSAGFALKYYFEGRFVEPPCCLKYGLTRSELVKQKQSELRDLARDIDGLKLPPKPTPDAGKSYEDPDYCEYPKDVQYGLTQKVKAVLRLALPDGFFNLGSLSYTGKTPGLDGTPVELDKYKKLERFRQGLDTLTGLLKFFVQLQAYHVIPLALCNTGELTGEGVRVQIALPKEVALLTENTFPRPEIGVISGLTGEDGLLHPLLHQSADANVKAYPVPYFSASHFSYLFFGPHKKEQEQKELSDDFDAYIKSLFCFTVAGEDPHYRIVEIGFEPLSPGECVALPSFLFVKADKSFTIKYRIAAKELSFAQVGRLEYDIR